MFSKTLEYVKKLFENVRISQIKINGHNELNYIK